MGFQQKFSLKRFRRKKYLFLGLLVEKPTKKVFVLSLPEITSMPPVLKIARQMLNVLVLR
jgi:hypothetical protein